MASETFVEHRVYGDVEGIATYRKAIGERMAALGQTDIDSYPDGSLIDVQESSFSYPSKQGLNGHEFEMAEQAARQAGVVTFVGVVDQDVSRGLARAYNADEGEIASVEMPSDRFDAMYFNEDADTHMSDRSVIGEMWMDCSDALVHGVSTWLELRESPDDAPSCRPSF